MQASYTRRKITALKILLISVPLLLLLLVLYTVLPLLREQGFLKHFDNHKKIQNDRFSVYLEEGDPAGEAVEAILEKFLIHLEDQWGGEDRMDLRSPRDLDFPVVVLLLKNEKRLRDYHGNRYREEFKNNAGMYERIAGTISLISNRLGGFRELRRGLYHESTHMVLDRLVKGRDQDWSLWLNEGLATYLEASREVEGVGFVLGDTSLNYLENLEFAIASKSMSLRDVLSLTHEDFIKTGNTRAYALSSLLVAFLLKGESQKYQESFWAYFDRERAPGPVNPGALERCLGLKLEDLAEPFRIFIQEELALKRGIGGENDPR